MFLSHCSLARIDSAHSPKTSPEPKQKASFDIANLCEDLRHIILTDILQTSPSTLFSLALVCRTYNTIATPYLYRNVVLCDERSNPWNTAKRRIAEQLLYKLRERGKRSVGQYIRELRVEELDSQLALEDILDCIENLRIFRWNANTTITSSVLFKLHTKWPDLKICIHNHKRNEAATLDRALDTALLSSTQLDSLDTTIYMDATGIAPFYSEWPELTRLLQKGGNCRSLEIHAQKDANRMVPKIFEDPANIGGSHFQLKTGSKLPALEELSISSSGRRTAYQFDGVHCALLKEALDWSRMRRLEFMDGFPDRFLSELCGHVPNLEHLRLRLPEESNSAPEVAARLISSVKQLKSLDLTGLETWIDVLWSAIKAHRETLETFVSRSHRHSYMSTDFIGAQFLESLASDFPRLRHLGINGKLRDMRTGAQVSGIKSPLYFYSHLPAKARERLYWSIRANKLQLDEDYLAPLLKMDLHTLDLTLLLPNGPSVFTATESVDSTHSYLPSLSIKRSKTVAVMLGERISRAQRRPLQNLNMCFLRRNFEVAYSGLTLMEARMQLRRSDRDDVEMMDELGRWKVKGAVEWRPSS